MDTYLGYLFSHAVGREEHWKQTSLARVGSVSATLGLPPAHGMCAFPLYTAQAPGCSAGNCVKRALGCVHFPGLSCSGSGSWEPHQGAHLVGPTFCALPRPEQLRRPGAWGAHSLQVWGVCLLTSPIPAAWFPWCAVGAPSQVCPVSPEES